MSAPRSLVLVVGDELISGSKDDVNGPRISRVANGLGHDVVGRLYLPDSTEEIARAISRARGDGIDLVWICGGLGPTVDDLTREGVSQGLERDLEVDPVALERIEKRYRERGRELPVGARRQAMRPSDAETLANPVGVAPGFLAIDGSRAVVALPGVPRELVEMLERVVLPRLRAWAETPEVRAQVELHLLGLGETDAQELVTTTLGEREDLRLGFFAGAGEVEIVLGARGEALDELEVLLDGAVERLREPLGAHLLAVRHVAPGDHAARADTLVETVRDDLLARDWTLGSAESCTGGLFASRVTDLPGASAFFAGSVVGYANAVKEVLLDVEADLLESCGAVSAVVARQMARGCRRRLGVDVGVSLTGIAGPSGGGSDKPVGLVFIGVASPDATRVSRHVFAGDRESIRRLAVTAALDEIRRLLRDLPPLGELVDE